MSISTDLGQVQEDMTTTPDSCIAELSYLLGEMTTDANSPRPASFPAILFDAILHTEFIANADDIKHLVLAVDKTRAQVHEILHRDSIRLLAYALLNSCDIAGQESGLYILLGGPRNHTETVAENPQGGILPCSVHSSSIWYKLIAILYTTFLDEGRPVQCRRLTGKLLVELMVESKDTGTLILKPQDLTVYCPRTASVVCHETDIVLRFFAGCIIHVLQLSGTHEDVLWSSGNHHFRAVFSKCLQENPHDWIRSFHHYIGEVEHHESRNLQENLRAKPKMDERTTNTEDRLCHLIRSVTIGSHSYARCAILVSFTHDNLVFIIPAKESVSGYFQYIEIPAQYILESTYDPEELADKRYLRFSLDTTGSMIFNGTKQALRRSTAYITSDSNLRELCNALGGSRRTTPKKGPIIGRISSTVVALDNGSEVARKSIQYCEESSQVHGQDCLSVDKSHNLDDEQKPQLPGHSTDEPHHVLERAQRAPTMDEILPVSNEVAHMPKETCGSVSPDGEDISEPKDGDVQTPGKDISPTDCDINIPRETSQDRSEILDPKGLTSDAKTEAKPTDDGTGPNTTNVVSNALKRIRSTRSNVVSRKESLERHIKRGRASTNTKDRSKLPNTQESLVFHRLRRTKRKVHTSGCKAAVDWDEDLRPTEDEEEAETEIQKDPEVTSVSSPSSEGTSIFTRMPNTAQKRKARAAPSSVKGKGSTKRNRASVDRSNKKTAMLPLHTKDKNTDNNSLQAINSHGAENTTNKDGNGGTHVSNETEIPHGLTSHFIRPKNIISTAKQTQSSSQDRENRDPLVNISQNQGEVAEIADDEAQESKARYGGSDGSQLKANFDLQAQELSGKGQDSTAREITISQDRHSFSESTAPSHDRNICLDNEAGSSLARYTSIQAAQVSYDSPSHRGAFNQHEGSIYPQTVSKSNDGLRFFPEKHCIHNTPLQATTGEGNQKNLQQSGLGKYHSASRSRKSTTTMNGSQNMKPRINISVTVDHHPLHKPGDLATEKSGFRQSKNGRNSDVPVESPEAVKRKSIVTTSGKPRTVLFKTPEPKSRASRMGTNVSHLLHTTSQERPTNLSRPSTSSPKKSLVDENGSPRLVSRHSHGIVDFGGREAPYSRAEQWEDSMEGTDSPSEYDGDYDSVSGESSIPTLQRTKHVISSERNGWRTHSASSFVSDADRIGELDSPNTRRRIPVTERLRRCAKRPNCPIEYSISGSQKARLTLEPECEQRAPEAEDPAARRPPSITATRLQRELTQSGQCIEGDHSQLNWQVSLESIQKATHDMLLNTNDRLTHQLEDEKDTISQALDTYRQGCHQVLNRLFKAHEERIGLYRQQMASVRQQHRDLCRDLIRRLEENDRRIRDAMMSGSSLD